MVKKTMKGAAKSNETGGFEPVVDTIRKIQALGLMLMRILAM
jgi:hypothetical protein